MPKVVLVTDPAHDNITSYFGLWARKTIEEFRSNPEIEIIELVGPDTTREKFEQVVASHSPALILINGHGNDHVVAGIGHEILVAKGENSKVLASAISHLLACATANSLGPEIISQGGKAYIGYTNNFNLVSTSQTTDEARKGDAVAALMLDPAFETVKALMEGASVSEAYFRSQEEYKLRLRRMRGNPKWSVVEALLFQNARGQTILGDIDARI